jgi:hypothetical protein
MDPNQIASILPEKPCFLLGRNSRGHWTVRDRDCLQGGLFASLAAAQRYARLHTIGRDATIVMVDHLELDLSAPPPYVGKTLGSGTGSASIARG